MCSYNRLNGKPTCGNAALTDTLRKDMGFTGYVRIRAVPFCCLCLCVALARVRFLHQLQLPTHHLTRTAAARPPPPPPQITSDSDSCADIALSHHYESTLDLAARDCLLSGTDIDSGGTYSGHLAKAVAAGLNTSYVESALRNSYKVHGMAAPAPERLLPDGFGGVYINSFLRAARPHRSAGVAFGSGSRSRLEVAPLAH